MSKEGSYRRMFILSINGKVEKISPNMGSVFVSNINGCIAVRKQQQVDDQDDVFHGASRVSCCRGM